MQEKVYKTKIANVDELCDRIVNAWEELDQHVIEAAVRQWRACLRACVSSWWTLWTYSMTEINLVIYFKWLVPCLLLKLSINCFAKVTLSEAVLLQFSKSCILQGMRDNNIKVWWSVLLLPIYKVFLHICWQFDENTCTTNQIMTKNARFLFFRSQSIYQYGIYCTHWSGVLQFDRLWCQPVVDHAGESHQTCRQRLFPSSLEEAGVSTEYMMF